MRQEDIAGIHSYLYNVAQSQGVTHIVVGGIGNHVHLMGEFSLNRKTSDVVRALKSNSSYHCKNLHSHYKTFSWQEGYGYFSVSPSQYGRVADYIRNQVEHHKKMTAEEEFHFLLNKAGLLSETTSQQT